MQSKLASRGSASETRSEPGSSPVSGNQKSLILSPVAPSRPPPGTTSTASTMDSRRLRFRVSSRSPHATESSGGSLDTSFVEGVASSVEPLLAQLRDRVQELTAELAASQRQCDQLIQDAAAHQANDMLVADHERQVRQYETQVHLNRRACMVCKLYALMIPSFSFPLRSGSLPLPFQSCQSPGRRRSAVQPHQRRNCECFSSVNRGRARRMAHLLAQWFLRLRTAL